MASMEAEEIEKKLMEIWPGIARLVRFDSKYQLPSMVEVIDSVVAEGSLSPAEGSDCDDFALHLHSRIKWHHPDWAFGECFGTRFRGRDVDHNVNICMTYDKGVILIEPQEPGDWWVPDDDNILWARI